MRTRIAASAALAAAALAAPAASAAHRLVVVRPEAPVVGKRVTITVSARSARPLTLQLVSPTGVLRRVPLRNVAPGRWRATYHFADDGQWLLRVLRVHLEGSVWVQQPPTALPPYRPNAGRRMPGITGILGQGSFVYP